MKKVSIQIKWDEMSLLGRRDEGFMERQLSTVNLCNCTTSKCCLNWQAVRVLITVLYTKMKSIKIAWEKVLNILR